MAVRRDAARIGTVGALLAALVVGGAAPALADDDSVRVGAASSFRVGGSPGSASVEVRRRAEGCVIVRTVLALQLPGARADQVRVEVARDGDWRQVSVSGEGMLTTQRTTASEKPLCKGKKLTARYRVTFLAGAPSGRLDLVGEATRATGGLIGRGADAAKVVGGVAVGATPSPTPTRKPTPTPSPTEAVATVPAGTDAAAPVAGGGVDVDRAAAEEDSSGVGGVVMFVGVGLVVIGIALIVLLFRRSRADRRPSRAESTRGQGPGQQWPPGEYSSGATGPGQGWPAGPGTAAGRPTTPPGPPAQPWRPAGPADPPPRSAGQPPHPGGTGGTTYRSGADRRPGPPPADAGGGDSTAILPRLPG